MSEQILREIRDILATNIRPKAGFDVTLSGKATT